MKKLVLAVGAISAGLAFAETTPTVRYFDDGGEVMPVEDTVTLGSGGKIVYSGDATLEPVVNATDDLTIESTLPAMIFSSYLTLFPKTTEDPLILFTNRSLADYDPAKSTFDTPVAENKSHLQCVGDVKATFIQRAADDSWVTAEMRNSSGQVVKIKLTQVGSDIGVQALWVKYKVPEGVSAETTGTSHNIATYSSNGYNLDSLLMTRREVATVSADRLAATNSIGCASLALAEGAVVTAEGNVFAPQGGTFSAPVTQNGLLTLKDFGLLSMTGALSGNYGEFVFTSSDTASETSQVTGADYIPVTPNWGLLAENQTLARMSDFIGQMNGGWMSLVTDTYMYGFINNGQSASCYISHGTANRAALLKFRQNGANVEVQQTEAYYYQGTPPSTKYYDFAKNPEKITVKTASRGADGYGVLNWTATFADDRSYLNLASSAQDLMRGAVTVSGTEARPMLATLGDNVVPQSGELHIGPYATAVYGGANSVANYASAIYVHSNSLFRLDGREIKRDGACKVVVDGGTFEINVSTSYTCYMQQLTLKNGARLCGSRSPLGVGYFGAGVWTVTGNAPSTSSSGISLTSASVTDFTLTVDETGNGPAADFTMDGPIVPGGSNNKLRFKKNGAGTFLFNGGYSADAQPILIADGVFEAGKTATFLSTQKLILAGGGFAVDSDQAVDTLELTADGTLAVADNATLAFADSSAVAWAEGARLTVTLGEGAKLRFGTSASALTAGQLAQIKVNDRKAVIDEEGFVGPKPKLGIAILVR